jgi:predicted DNA binding protein/PAS domain-containing protein/putative methionine-R-sulfoxide reductase with GAF domain
MTRALDVLVASPAQSAAESVAHALDVAAESIDLDVATVATDEPADAAGPFDCLVGTAPDVVTTLAGTFPDVPLICYLDAAAFSPGDLSSIRADALVQQAGESSATVLATRVERLVGGESGRQQVTAMIDRADEAVFALDDDWAFTYLNDEAAALLERSPEELRGGNIWEVFQAAVGSTFYDEFHRAVRTRTPATFEEYYPPLDRHLEATAYPTDEGLVVHLRDITDWKRQEQALSGVLETTRALMQARTREEVAELLARAAENTLGFEYNVVRLYDAETETLVPAGVTESTAADLAERPVYGIDEGAPGEVFTTGEARRDTETSEPVPDPLTSVLYLPIGVHGTISIGSTDPDAFDEIDQQIAQILATNAAVAFSRAKREQEVREARERVETLLERINGLVRETLEVLVQATTREEIETGVCEQFTTASPYSFAWLGTADIAGETLSATAWAGDDELDVSDYECDLTVEDSLDPSANALQSRDSVVVSDLADSQEVWARAAVDAGLGSLCAIPLQYKDTVYGVVTVYADRPDAFDDRERAVLEALGRAIADAINAVERGRILSTNRVVEMRLASRDPELLFSRLSAKTDCRIESTGTLYQSDGTLQLYLRAETDDAESIGELLSEDSSTIDATHVVSHDGTSLFDVTVTESVVETLAEFGAVTKHIEGEDGMTRLTIELPHETDARDVYDVLADRYEDLELAGYHEHDRPVQTRQEFRAALRERFTDRQETALRSAYLGGFFEWPRDVDGDDLAGSMGITRPTYHQHLRVAERKVFEELFD